MADGTVRPAKRSLSDLLLGRRRDFREGAHGSISPVTMVNGRVDGTEEDCSRLGEPFRSLCLEALACPWHGPVRWYRGGPVALLDVLVGEETIFADTECPSAWVDVLLDRGLTRTRNVTFLADVGVMHRDQLAYFGISPPWGGEPLLVHLGSHSSAGAQQLPQGRQKVTIGVPES